MQSNKKQVLNLIQGDTLLFCVCVLADGEPVSFAGSQVEAVLIRTPGGSVLGTYTLAGGAITLGNGAGQLVLRVNNTSAFPLGMSVIINMKLIDTSGATRTLLTEFINVIKPVV